ncbi:MAG: DUF2178 domain-containing protein [Candidatus Gracilibacteria bacterium]|nr:DUF2178 domain-containing protein [Candidatus Gracilibacteria bacterium]
MKISLKKYNKIRFIIVILIAIIISQSLVYENYIIPIFVIIIGSLILFFIRGKVKEIIADERDYIIGGKAAIYSIQIFSWIGAISMFILYYFQNSYPIFETIAQTLGFLICFLMLLYSFIFSLLNKEGKFNKKLILYTIYLIILIGFFLYGFFHMIINKDEKLKENINYKIEKQLNIQCNDDNDCETPGEYLIRSNCPYTSKCIKDKCNVICPNF